MFNDFYFQCTDSSSFYADLLHAGVMFVTSHSIVSSSGEFPNVTQSILWETGSARFVEGVDIDYIGAMVSVPATFDTSSFPPVLLTSASYYEGERANLRTSNPEVSASIASAVFVNGTQLLPAPKQPKRRWA